MRRQRGSVIIIVLWTSILLTVLVTVMAGKVQLSARTAFHNRTAVTDMANVASAMNQAEMELILERMQLPIDQELELDEEGVARTPAYRFNGQPLTLQYPTGDDIVVRIYDHAGKINLNRIRAEDLRLIIEKRLGLEPDAQVVQDLLAAWTDWTDLNDMAGINGAESEYYETLDPPYSARNSPELDTVEELRLIRGFDELFKGFNLEAAFTVYGSGSSVNFNLATREALQLLPGLTDELIEQLLLYRETREFRNRADVGDLIPVENLVEVSNWIGNNTSVFYSVYAYPRAEVDPVTQAFMEIWEVRSPAARARVYKADPYAQLPDTSPPTVVERRQPR
jgi:general secretion pathway protein K